MIPSVKIKAKKSTRQSGSLRFLAAGVCTVAMICVATEPISSSLLSSAGAMTIKAAPAVTHVASSRSSSNCPTITNTGTPTTTSYLTVGAPTVSESGYVPTTTTEATNTGVPTSYTTSTAGTGYVPTTSATSTYTGVPTIYTTSTAGTGYVPTTTATSTYTGVPTIYTTSTAGTGFVPTTSATSTYTGVPTIYTTSTAGTGYVPTTTSTQYYTGQPTVYTTGTNYTTSATTTPGTPTTTTYHRDCTPVTLSLPTHHGWAPVGSSNYKIAFSTNDAAGIHFTSLDRAVCSVNAKTGVIKAHQAAFCEILVAVTHTNGYTGVVTSRFQLNVANKGQALITSTVSFANNSTVLTAADRAKLNSAVALIKTDQLLNVVVNGNASPTGSSAQNLKLSQKRAQVTVSYLETKIAALGIENVNFHIKWFGDKATKTRSATVFGF